MKNKETKQAICFIMAFIALFIVGFFCGRLLKNFDINSILQSLSNRSVGIVLTIIFSVVTVIGMGLMIGTYVKSKTMMKHWDGNDEDMIIRIENILNYPVISASIVMIFSCCLYSCCCYFLLQESKVFDILPTMCELICLAGSFVITKKTIDLEKQLNPEKKGSLLNLNFEKQWMESCDEAQKLIIYRAGYSGYQAGKIACPVMWILGFVGQLVFQTGVLPVVCICTIWLVMAIAYLRTSLKLEK